VAAIEVRDLTKRYRQGQPNEVCALDGVTLTVEAGEFVSVEGRSGSGKTTLLHSAGLLVRPTSGQVVVDGVDAGRLTDGRRADLRGRRIGFVFQARHLLPTLTALENVMLPLRYGWIRRGAKARARDLLGLVGLGDRMDRRPDQHSAGQAQRVAIARAMIRSPALVLADEPTGEVDSETSDELLYLMQQLNRMSGVAFVVATHDTDVASCMDRMVRIRDGRVVSDQRLRVDQSLHRDGQHQGSGQGAATGTRL
jgi:ABC-type lipoprotein export system ATPase subunit